MLDIKKIDKEYFYEGDDLGCVYGKTSTSFRVWSPIAKKVELNIYSEGKGDCLEQKIPMMLEDKGTWHTIVEGDLDGKYYTYTIQTEKGTNEVTDVYAKAAGVNGNRAMVLDFQRTNPEGWLEDKGPELEHKTDAIIYELHVRDLSSDENSGIQHKYLFEGLTEEGTKSKEGEATGLDHIKELGVTHVHLLPLHDFGSVDEERPELMRFNWGYDPQNYSVLEGSYSSDPYHGEVRIREFKNVVHSFHKNGIGVIMDVVYNHTYKSSDSVFEQTMPGYYYRMESDDVFADGSACGNETASNHLMMRKFMIDSLCFWAKEYHIDGFRFDLMGIHDIETMNQIATALKKINPQILLYGEGWAAKPPKLSEDLLAMKKNVKKMPDYAMFSDNIRDVTKGHVFEFDAKGFVNGEKDMEEELKSAIVASTKHSQIKGVKDGGWAGSAEESINYASAHDDLALWDKLCVCSPDATEEEIKDMNKLTAAIVLLSQGIPFMQAGEEFARTKPGDEVAGRFTKNSYNSPDEINAIRWSRKTKYKDVLEYYKGLIRLRKATPAFRMVTTEQIEKRLKFLEMPKNIVGYTIHSDDKEESTEVCVIYNANKEAQKVEIPKGVWKVYVNNKKAGNEEIATLEGGTIVVEAVSALVLGR